ncbi:MAG: diguanylate cyclase [Pirellulaceae bacterium]
MNELNPVFADGNRMEWKQLADSAPAMLWYIDENGMPLYYNRQWLRFAGIDGSSDLGNAWSERLHPEDLEWVMRSSWESLKNRQSIRLEYRLRRYDGEYRNVLDMGEPQFDSEGMFIGYIGTTVDITEQRQDAIALKKSHEELNRTATEIKLLNELNDNLQVCKNINETRLILKRFGRQLFPESSVAICLFSESRNIVEPFVAWGDSVAIKKMFAPDDCWALRRGKLHAETPCNEGGICPNAGNCTRLGYLCVPMMAYGEVIGVLNIAAEKHAQLAQDIWERNSKTHRLAQICSDQIALAIANLKLRETLHFQSTRDTLTQLYNRRYLLDNLEREFCRAKRNGTPVSLMMIDADYFKRFNDTYGHDAGDLVLRELGAVLKASCRDSDIPCRYGGEEFVIALMDTSKEAAIECAEEIRKRVDSMSVQMGNAPLGKISVSVGVATFPDAAQEISRLLTCSDHALYEAKREGRDRVICFQESDGTHFLMPSGQVDATTGFNSVNQTH